MVRLLAQISPICAVKCLLFPGLFSEKGKKKVHKINVAKLLVVCSPAVALRGNHVTQHAWCMTLVEKIVILSFCFFHISQKIGLFNVHHLNISLNKLPRKVNRQFCAAFTVTSNCFKDSNKCISNDDFQMQR